MPLPDPVFDNRTYREILNEALARIPGHNPEWTNLNDADPGVTLLQLFAFMAENITYRANLIPERNRQKFLRLLGIPMRPAAPAKGLVTFHNPRGAFEVLTLEKDMELRAGNVPFRTENGLDVLPIEARLYYKKPLSETRDAEVGALYRKLYAAYDLPDTELEFYETAVFEPAASGVILHKIDISRDTKDGALWVALLARPGEAPGGARQKIANKVLSVGILPALDEEGRVIYPLGPPVREKHKSLLFELPIFEPPNAVTQNIRYEPLEPEMNHDPLSEPGIVKLTLPEEKKLAVWEEGPLTAGVGNRPPSLEETDDADRLITWIRIRSPQIDTRLDASSRQLSINLSWVGINAAEIVQRAKVPAQLLPRGTGAPDQRVVLAHTPVMEDSVRLSVNGEIWTRIDDLTSAEPEVRIKSPRFASDTGQRDAAIDDTAHDASTCKVYTLDPESGEIRFGDGARGMRPPAEAVIQASYFQGGGTQGMVGIGSIKSGPALPSGIKVANPVPTWGGSRAETVDEAEKNIPNFIRHKDRLVSEQDCRDIALRTPGVDLGRVEVLSLFHPKLPRQTAEGVVTLLVIPETDPQYPKAPRPDQLFLETMCAWLSPRRILTTELHLRGPVYKTIWIAVGINTMPGFDPGPVREKVKKEIERFLSPLEGGFEKTGWPLNKVVDALETAAVAARVPGVSKVNALRLGESDGVDVPEVSMEGLELPHLIKVVVTSGDALTLGEIMGHTEISDIGGDGTGSQPPQVVPVPVVPPQC